MSSQQRTTALTKSNPRTLARRRTYLTWRDMNRRCFSPKNHAYDRYGARGITVCERWRVFENFLADMGIRPEGLTIERINNDGNYEPSNCCWIPKSEQNRN